MPLPFILAGAAVAAAGFGAKKGFDGFQKKAEANEIAEEFRKAYDEHKAYLDLENKRVSEALDTLGQLQLKIASDFGEFKSIADELIGKIENSQNKEVKISIPQHRLDQVVDLSISAQAFIGHLAGGAAAGGAAAFAVYSGVMAFAAAGTGTPIAALSGIAAKNAALAFLGGGPLAAGGFGMAGGAMVLGAVVAAPIIAIAGLGFDRFAQKAKENALDYKKEVESAIYKMTISIEHLYKTANYVGDLTGEIERIYRHFNSYFEQLKSVNTLIKADESMIPALSDKIVKNVDNGFKIAAILTDIITTPLFKVKKMPSGKVVMGSDDIPEMEKDQNGLQILNDVEINNSVSKGTEEAISKTLES